MHKWIPLARVAREHGLTKGETSFLRCDLLQVGGLAFQSAKLVAFSAHPQNSEIEILDVSEPIKPLGGKWGEAKAIILPIPKNRKWTRGEWVSVPRENFPSLGEGELYLCDLMGLPVSADASLNGAYRVIGIEDRSIGSTEALSLILKDEHDKVTFEVPVKGIDWSKSSKDHLVIPTVEDWKSLA